MLTKLNPETPVKKQVFIDLKGLKTYLIIMLSAIAAFLYLQINGICIYNDSSTEHEGNNHVYGRHHK